MYKWTRSTSVNNAQTRNKLQTNTTRYDTTASNWWRRDCIYHSWTIIEWMLVTHEWLWSLTMTHGHSDRGHSDRGSLTVTVVTVTVGSLTDRGSLTVTVGHCEWPRSLWPWSLTMTTVTHSDRDHIWASSITSANEVMFSPRLVRLFVFWLDNSKSCVWNFEMM